MFLLCLCFPSTSKTENVVSPTGHYYVPRTKKMKHTNILSSATQWESFQILSYVIVLTWGHRFFVKIWKDKTGIEELKWKRSFHFPIENIGAAKICLRIKEIQECVGYFKHTHIYTHGSKENKKLG